MKFVNMLADKKNELFDLAVVWVAADAHRALKTFLWALIGAAAVGWAVGLFVFGWALWPVEYVGATMHDLSVDTQRGFVTAVSDLYAYKGNMFEVKFLLADWSGETVACQLAESASSLDAKARLINTAYAINGYGCR